MTGEWTAGLQFGLSLLVWGVVLRTVYRLAHHLGGQLAEPLVRLSQL